MTGWRDLGRRARRVRREARGLQIAFQPVVDLATGTVSGFEALSRFPRDLPEALFRDARRVGLGFEVELSAVVQALALTNPLWGYVSVNVSPATLLSSAFEDLVDRLHAPDRLVVELTEHAVVADYDHLIAAIARLRGSGVRIAVDDAGSGISSFRHILQLAPEMVKLDRTLIAGIDEDRAQRALVASLVQFAMSTSAELIAEGIEREQERQVCLELGIRFGQGFLLGRPQVPGRLVGDA